MSTFQTLTVEVITFVILFNIVFSKENIQIKGFGLSPVGFPDTYIHLNEFFKDLTSFSSIYGYNFSAYDNTLWRDNISSSGDISTMTEYVANECLKTSHPCITIQEFGWRSGNTLYLDNLQNPQNNWGNIETQQLYQQTIIEYCTNYSYLLTPYIFLGNEVDYYYEQNETDYINNWIPAYNMFYDNIKLSCPKVKIGTIFQWEHLSGNGGLNYIKKKSYWKALTSHDFNKVDIIGMCYYVLFFIYILYTETTILLFRIFIISLDEFNSWKRYKIKLF